MPSGQQTDVSDDLGPAGGGAWARVRCRLELSERELEVVLCFLEDLAEGEIARRLQISRHTVHSHIGRIYRKLGVSTRCKAVLVVVGELARSCRVDGCVCPLLVLDWPPD